MSSPLILPAALSSASGWHLADYRQASITGKVAAGRIEAAGPQLADNELWLIDHAVIACTSTSATTLRLYDTYEQVANLLSGSDTGNFDEADYPAGLQVQPSRLLLAVWSAAAAGAVGTLNVQYRLFRQG